MNTRQVINDYKGPPAHTVSYNQDYSLFSVATSDGYRVYDTLECKIRDTDCVVVTGGGEQPAFTDQEIVLWDDTTGGTVWSLSIVHKDVALFPIRILLNWGHMVVVGHYNCRLYELHGNICDPPKKLLHVDTILNPLGLCCLSSRFFVYPGEKQGQVKVVDIPTLKTTIIPAHQDRLRAMAISRDSVYLATASENGRIVRIWSVSDGARVIEFRRGIDSAKIFSMAFSPSSNMLAVTSDKSTLHIFDLGTPFGGEISISSGSKERRSSSDSNFSFPEATQRAETPKGKWGPLGDIPGMPRYFSDNTSAASARFTIGDESRHVQDSLDLSSRRRPDGRAEKGVIGWPRDDLVTVLGAGQDARYERFVVGTGKDGKKFCQMTGWCSYMRQE